MKRSHLLILAGAIAAMTAAPALAQKTGGVKITGEAEQQTTVGGRYGGLSGGVTTEALDQGAVAETRIGTVGGQTTIKGDLEQTTTVTGGVTTRAKGSQAVARTRIGDIRNAEIDDDVTQTTHITGSVETRAEGQGAQATTEVGTIGD